MKPASFFLSFLLGLISFVSTTAQNWEPLQKQEKWDTIPRGRAVIYGKFVQGLGFKSGGLAQFVHILNLGTKKMYTMEVKRKMTSAEENPFIYVVVPGKYAIVDYRYSIGEIKGTLSYTNSVEPSADPIKRNTDSTSGRETKAGPYQITFEVSGRTLNYVGTWDFRNYRIVFRNEKEQLDPEFRKYKKLDFGNAKMALPVPVNGYYVPYLPTGYINDPQSIDEININRDVERRYSNIAPLFGRVRKSNREIKYDQEFIDTAISQCKCSRAEASRKWSKIGWDYLDRGKKEIASKRFNQSWLLDSMNYSPYWGFGVIMGSQQRNVEAIPLFQKAYELKQEKHDKTHAYLCADYSLSLARLYDEKKQDADLTRALDLLLEAETVYPGWGKINNDRSRLLFGAGRFAGALSEYEKAIALDPKYIDQKYNDKLKERTSGK